MNKDDHDEESPAQQSTGDDDSSVPTKASAPTPKKNRCRFISLLSVSAFFFALFIYSASVQKNDPDGLQWLLFYSFHASVAGMFILHISCFFPDKVIYFVSSAMSIWSAVFIVIAAVKLHDAIVNGGKYVSQDIPGLSTHEELIFELVGALLTLMSALYHMIMTKCCGNKKVTQEEPNVMS